MQQTFNFRDKLKVFLVVFLPIVVTQVSMYLMNFFDTVMSGQVGASDLAGVAIGSSLWVPIYTGINGIVLALTPIVSQFLGAQSDDKITKRVQQALFLSVILAIVIYIIGGLLLNPILNFMDLETKVRHIAKYYLITISIGLIPLFIFNTARSFIDALGQTRISMIIILISLPINIVLNYLFIFGKLGIPAFGGIGSGIATAITYWIVSILSLVIIHKIKPFQKYHILTNWVRPSISAWIEQLKIGIPIGLAIFFETSIFSAVTLFMSVYSTYTIAAHQAALNFATLLYMVPLSVGIALTIVIGFEVGAKRHSDARTYGYIGLGSGLFIAIFAGVILYIFDEFIASLYNTNPEVIALTKQFIFFAIFFQLADAFAAPIQGALRGYKDVNLTLVIALISYWVVGLPSGWLFANLTALGAFGYWIGLIIGLSCGAIALFFRLLFIQRKNALP